MLSILAIVLGLVIIVAAIAADRSARARHPFRAIVLNLFGIACLALGVVSVFAWSHHHRIDRNIQVAVATPDGDRAAMVRLVVGRDGHLEHPVDVESLPDKSQPDVETPAEAEVAEDADTIIKIIELDGLDDSEDIGLGENGQLELNLTQPEIGKVEIDFDARPEWVDQPDVDNGDTHLVSVTSGPFKKLRVARNELYSELKKVTDQYINEIVGSPHAAHWVGYDKGEIRHRFVAPDHFFDEKVLSPSVGVMHQSHALLEFNSSFHNEVEQAWFQVQARAQLVKVALAGGAILGMLALLFGYFNADTATRGFYSGRLKFVTAVAILTLVAAGLFVARSIPWLWL